ncbi:f-box domain-containing protein [Gigaspora margarita]|uniref:F-box domain-containing protein n=1 Tax=Gigaspora margarita TaxID=4874 RepID=A0A8H4ARW1_GIGMA|nr:f-box domain-containing protein [Gigaspora margarita]
MITLPNECYYAIFNNLCHDYKNLFSCALVNRHWCRVIIPILWSKPKLKNIKLIRIFLLTLNVNEQALLIPFKITLPSHPKPLFEYTNYITSINSDYLHNGVRSWLTCEGFEMYKRDEASHELENAVESSLIVMLLRTSNICISKD